MGLVGSTSRCRAVYTLVVGLECVGCGGGDGGGLGDLDRSRSALRTLGSRARAACCLLRELDGFFYLRLVDTATKPVVLWHVGLCARSCASARAAMLMLSACREPTVP